MTVSETHLPTAQRPVASVTGSDSRSGDLAGTCGRALYFSTHINEVVRCARTPNHRGHCDTGGLDALALWSVRFDPSSVDDMAPGAGFRPRNMPERGVLDPREIVALLERQLRSYEGLERWHAERGRRAVAHDMRERQEALRVVLSKVVV